MQSLRSRQYAVMLLAARAHTGWTWDDGDRGDRWQVHKTLDQISDSLMRLGLLKDAANGRRSRW